MSNITGNKENYINAKEGNNIAIKIIENLGIGLLTFQQANKIDRDQFNRIKVEHELCGGGRLTYQIVKDGITSLMAENNITNDNAVGIFTVVLAKKDAGHKIIIRMIAQTTK